MKAITDPTKLPTANKDVDRFLSKIKISTERFWNGTPCWEWLAGQFNSGYGGFWFAGQQQYAHRISYCFFVDNPGNLFVLHRCDNPPCVNPNHLFLGTHADNMQDMCEKNRNAAKTKPERISRGKQHSQRMKEVAARGERHGSAKLKDTEISHIFKLRKQGLLQREIAAIFGVTQAQISNILKRGEKWIA